MKLLQENKDSVLFNTDFKSIIFLYMYPQARDTKAKISKYWTTSN